MDRRQFLSQSISRAVVAGGACLCTGCGSVFHSERVGQPHSRDIDWRVAGLDALGLAFFFVPGVVAFAVDFYTGAIYLPHEFPAGPQGQQYQGSPPVEITRGRQPNPPARARQIPPPTGPVARQQEPRNLSRPVMPATLQRVSISPKHLDLRGIEYAVARRVGQQITLNGSSVRVSPLFDLSQFETAYQRHQLDPRFGISPRQFFERLPTV